VRGKFGATPQDQFVIIVCAARMSANTMQHLNGEGLIKGQALASAHVRNVRPMAHPLLPFRPSGNALRSGMTTSSFRGNLVDFQTFPLCALMGIGFDSSHHFHLLALIFLRLCKRVHHQMTVIQYVYLTVFFHLPNNLT
jgi:hypothetical protein